MATRIAIVGAGITGRMLAWYWLQYGPKDLKLLFYNDRPFNQPGAASFTAAGMLAPFSELVGGEALIFELGLAGIEAWSTVNERLAHSIGFYSKGTLVVSHAADISYFEHFRQQLQRKLRTHFAFAEPQVTLLGSAQLMDKDSALSEHFSKALHLPSEGAVNTQQCMSALQSRIENDSRATLKVDSVATITPHTVISQGGCESVDLVYDTRGLSAHKELSDLRGVRGELLWVHAPRVNIQHMVRLIHPRYRLYLVPRDQHRYLLGATELESHFKGAVTVRSALELLSAAASIHSGFLDAEILKLDSNLRPAFRDNVPKIVGQEGLIRINGLFRHGFLLAPVMAKCAFYFGCGNLKALSPTMQKLCSYQNASLYH